MSTASNPTTVNMSSSCDEEDDDDDDDYDKESVLTR